MDSVAQQTLGSLVQVAAPAATVPPVFQYAPVYPRQDKVDTCGYLALTKGFQDVLCPGSCTTTGSFFGCDQWFFTTCYDSRDAMCSTGSLGLLDKCCTHTNMPNCVTASKNVENDWLTYYACGADPVSGTYLAVDDKSKATSKQSSSAKITSVTSSTTSSDAATSTSVRNSGPTEDQSNADKSTSNANETNVGAIVGGVLGGIALIALIGFGIWFIRFQKRKGTKEPEEAHSDIGLTEKPPADQPYPGTEYAADTPKSDFSVATHPTATYPQTYPTQAVEAPAGDYAATMHQPTNAHHPGYHTQLVEAPSDNNKRAELM